MHKYENMIYKNSSTIMCLMVLKFIKVHIGKFILGAAFIVLKKKLNV